VALELELLNGARPSLFCEQTVTKIDVAHIPTLPPGLREPASAGVILGVFTSLYSDRPGDHGDRPIRGRITKGAPKQFAPLLSLVNHLPIQANTDGWPLKATGSVGHDR
jgi:hypothetical protein